MTMTADQARALQTTFSTNEISAQGSAILDFTYGLIENAANNGESHVLVPTQPSLALFVMNDLFTNGFSVTQTDSTTLTISWAENL